MRSVSVTAIRKNAEQILDQVNRDGSAVLVTKNEIPTAYLIDAATFEQELDRIEELTRFLGQCQPSRVAD